MRAFVLPQLAPAVSCGLTYDGPSFMASELQTRPLVDAETFMAEAAPVVESASGLALAFLDVQGLEGLADDVAARMNRRIEATLQSAAVQGSSAAQLTPERFALLRAPDDRRDIAAEIVEAGRAEGVDLSARNFASDVPEGAETLCVLRAMRFAIEGCLKNDGLANPQLAFADSLKRPFPEAETFRTLLQARDFPVHYQPLVPLHSRPTHTSAALRRSPAPPSTPPMDSKTMIPGGTARQGGESRVLKKKTSRVVRRPEIIPWGAQIANGFQVAIVRKSLC